MISLDLIHNMGCTEFSNYAKNNMPVQFYKYYPNTEHENTESGDKVNYSIQALKNNTVFLQTPTAFDDVYDSDINIDPCEYEHFRLIEYCKKCGIEVSEKQSTEDIGNAFVKRLCEYYRANGTLEDVFTKKPDSEIENKANKISYL